MESNPNSPQDPRQLELHVWPESEWTDEEVRVWRQIRDRFGRENAIRALDIAEATRIGADNSEVSRSRHMRDLVKHLIEFHKLPIASTCGPPYGYYRPWGAQEVNECYRWLVGLALSILKHASIFKKTSNLEALLGQLEMELK